MLLKSNVFRFIFSFCLIISVCAAVAFADTIRLKDGSVIKGRIVGFRDGQFVVQIGDGNRARQMTFFADEIDAVEFDSTASRAANTTSPNIVLPRPSPTLVPVNREIAGNQNEERIVVGQPNAGRQTATPTPAPTNLPTPIPSNTPVQTNRPANTPTPTPASTPANNTNNQTATVSARPKPIQLNLKVLADNTANGWTNAGWVVKKGQKIKISGSGRISLGNGNYATPTGLASLADKDKLMQNQATGGLLAVVGDDNNDFVFIGNSREFTATRDGALFLGINEGALNDNSGAFDVLIEIDPGVSN